MISLYDVSWHPYCAPEVERPELDILLTNVGEKGKSRPNPGTLLQKMSENQPLPAETPKTERDFPDKHRSTPLPGMTRTKLEKKSMPLPAQNQ